jgi:hypothetical protein
MIASVGLGSWSHEAADWRNWWRALALRRKIGPLVGVLAFWCAHLALGGFRGDHVALGLAVIVVGYSGPRGAPWFRLFLPAALMGAVYDGQGYVRHALAGHLTIHVSEPAAFDRTLFGIASPAGVLTPTQWLQLHTHAALDLLCGFVYVSFMPVFLGVAAWLRWQAGKTPGAEGAAQVRAAETMTWCLFWLGLISCVTYYLYPAAPPWYADKYGFGPAVLNAPASAAGAARVDALFGWHFFADIYGRNPNIFGAIPSLHVAIPLLAYCFADRAGRLRWSTGLYALWMAFSALYLNHHYILDLLWGAAYVGIIIIAVTWWNRRSVLAVR